MEDFRQSVRIVGHTYRLDAVDASMVARSMTSVANLIFPVFFGAWIAKKVIPLAHPDLAKNWLTLLKFTPVIATPLVGVAACLYQFSKPEFKALLTKYPPSTNFELRPKVNPFRLRKVPPPTQLEDESKERGDNS